MFTGRVCSVFGRLAISHVLLVLAQSLTTAQWRKVEHLEYRHRGFPHLN